jgi:hypothetical protein
MRLLIQGEAMADNSAPLKEQDDNKMTSEDLNEESGDNDGDGHEANRQDIFAATFERLMNGFGETCEKEGVEVAVALVKHPDFEEPFVFYRAPHIVDAASLMAEILRQVKSQVFSDLDTEPR